MAIVAQELAYRDGSTALTGILYRDTAEAGPSPGLVLVHGGAGLDEHARGQARRYTELGYVVLAADMFGDGVAGSRERVLECLRRLRDEPTLLVERGRAAVSALADRPEVDERRLGAVGFCFGGMAVLALARAGTPLAGVISVHGSLATSAPAAPGSVTAQILVLHGASDPHVPLEHVTAFVEEMTRAAATWQLVMYGGAQHGFTHANAVPGAIPGVEYDALADQRAFAAARTFLGEVLPG